MKRQGIEGHTYDSKAEEWAHWALGYLDNEIPMSPQKYQSLVIMLNRYAIQYSMEARLRNAQQQNALEIGVTTTQSRNSALWPLLALSVVCTIIALVCAAGMMGII